LYVLVVYTVIEGPDGKKRWVRIGKAHHQNPSNPNAGMSIELDALPTNARLQVRPGADHTPVFRVGSGGAARTPPSSVARARTTLEYFNERFHVADAPNASLMDLLVDIYHYCDHEGLDFEAARAGAFDHYTAEKGT
jgi:hypothetical protein